MPRSEPGGRLVEASEALLAAAAAGVLGLGLLQTGLLPTGPLPTGLPGARPSGLQDVARPGAAAPAAAPAGRPPAARGVPTAVRVPSLGLAEDLVPLRRQQDGTLEVPERYGDVGVWSAGGPVVLAGHVDSTDGPAVFFRLRELAPGDAVVLETAGAPRAYVVARVEQHAKDAFPTFEVFTGEGLRLVTCSGAFDRRAGSYRDNLVVYARPA